MNTRVWPAGRPFARTYRAAGFTEHENGDLTVTRRGQIIAIYPNGSWRRAEKKETS